MAAVRTVLLVDDDVAFTSLVRTWLEREGWQIEVATQGADARAWIWRGGIDAIIMDFVLPDEDGVGVVRAWRLAGFRGPVLAVTGAQSESVLEEFVLAGANHVVEKEGLGRAMLLAALDLAGASPMHPAAPTRPPRAESEPEPQSENARPPGHALIVDDTPIMRRLLRSYLEKDGWLVEEADCSAEALHKASAAAFDVVILDYLLPDIDGVGLLLTLRERGCKAGIVVITGHGAEAVAAEFAAAGAADFVPKHTLTKERVATAMTRALAARVDIVARPMRGRRAS